LFGTDDTLTIVGTVSRWQCVGLYPRNRQLIWVADHGSGTGNACLGGGGQRPWYNDAGTVDGELDGLPKGKISMLVKLDETLRKLTQR
jgi:hypothetical protein